MQRYRIQSRGVRLQVFDSKTESDVVLIFLHGDPSAGSKPLTKQRAIQQLEKNYHCIFFDQRGCGSSQYPLDAGVSKEDIIEDIHNVVKDCRSRYTDVKLVLFGDSFGGYFALLFLAQYPTLCDGVILSSPMLLLGSEEEQQLFTIIKQYYAHCGDRRLQKLLDILKDESPQRFFANTHVRQYIFSNRSSHDSLRFIASISDWLFSTSCIEALQQVIIPALIMKGREDVVTSEEHFLNVLVRIQNPFILYESFPECGHTIYEDQPQEFVEMIQRFLKDEFDRIVEL